MNVRVWRILFVINAGMFLVQNKIKLLGAPSTGGFPQCWGNDIFQSWGISPVLGKCHFFFLHFDNQAMMLGTYSFFFKCKTSYRLWKYFIYWVYQPFFGEKIEIFKIFIFYFPSTGEIPDFWGNLTKQVFPQYWGNLILNIINCNAATHALNLIVTS